ncbi:hypothetical protein Aperf_G00000098326 [Anoplocephala perfoliata]
MDRLEKRVRIPPQFVEYANKHSIYAIQEYESVNSKQFTCNSIRKIEPSVFILGPPCVGKYTLGKHVARKLNCIHIPVKTLRKNAEENFSQQNVEGATLYADYLKTRLAEEDCEKRGYVLTGFPATGEEGKALQLLGIFPEKIIVLDAPDNVLKVRAAGKVIDSLTGEPYHRIYNPPSDPIVAKRLEPTEDLKDLNSRIADYHHHYIILSQIYKNLIVNIPAERPLSDMYKLVSDHLSRPRRNPAMWTPRVVLLGSSGSGRKSVAEKLAKQYGLLSVHCGTLIRKEIIRNTKLGNAMKSYVDVHNAEVTYTLKGWVLFGFPRTRLQAQALDEADLAPNRVIFLNISQADAAARLNSRRSDTVTGEQYDLCQNPPPESVTSSGRLGRQPGMSESQVRLKIDRYAARRKELVEYYGDRALHVDADREEQTVYEQAEYLIVNEMPRPAKINPLANYGPEKRSILEDYLRKHHIMDVFEASLSSDWFTELPDLALRKVFSYLDPVDFANCAMVNQNWKVAVDLNAAASELDLSKVSSRATDKLLASLLTRRKATLRKISLENCSLLTEIGLLDLLLCNNLQVVKFAHCLHLTDGIIGGLLHACPTLVELDLSNTLITDKSLLQLVMHSIKLAWLSLAYCSNITDIGLEFFKGSRLASSVEFINLSGCSNVTTCGLVDCVKSMKGTHQKWVLNELPQITQEALEALTSKTNLKSLNYRRRKTPTKLSPIEMQFGRFKNEEEKEEAMTRKERFRTRIRAAVDLETLCIYGDERIESLELGASENLIKLAIVNCPFVDDGFLRGIMKLTSLRCINLSHSYWLTDEALRTIGDSNYVDRMEELYLAYCYQLKDNGIGPLLQKSIQKLEFDKPKTSTLEVIQNRCPYLRVLKLSKCSKITEADLKVLCEKCPQIRHLEVNSNGPETQTERFCLQK